MKDDNNLPDDSCWESVVLEEEVQATNSKVAAVNSRQTKDSEDVKYKVVFDENDESMWDALEIDQSSRTDALHSNERSTNPSPVGVGSVYQLSSTIEDDSAWESLVQDENIAIANKSSPHQINHIDDTNHLNGTTSNVTVRKQFPSSRIDNSTDSSFFTESNHRHRRVPASKESNNPHPIQIICSRFLIHFIRELWCSNIQVRLAIIMLSIGCLCNTIRMSVWYLYYPRQAFGVILLLLPAAYLNQQRLIDTIESVAKCFESPDHIADALADLNATYLRHGSIMLTFVIPLLLEIHTVHTLSDIHNDLGLNIFNVSIASLLVLVMLYLWKRQQKPLKLCIQTATWIFYGSALSLALYWSEWHRIPLLLGPFVIPTANLIFQDVQSEDSSFLSRIAQTALRHSIRDSFYETMSMVDDNEMLQLTMLRWIVDYWDSVRQQGRTGKTDNSNPTTDNQSSSDTNSPDASSRQSETMHDINISWSDLCSMLSLTSDQMSNEIKSLHQQKFTDTSNGSSRHDCDASNGSTRQDSANNSRSFPPDVDRKNGGGFLQELHAMFASMNLDEKIKPAVLEYKQKVNELPPSRELAFVVSVCRRCPTFLLLLWQIFFGEIGRLSSTLILLSLVTFEIFRIHAWLVACSASNLSQNHKQSLHVVILNFAQTADPMELLLFNELAYCTNDKSFVSVPSLLIVWRNVKSSVTALEMGLTAARCIQTVNASAEFALNIISLVHFGYEISEKGWVHGLTVIAKEIMTLHYRETSDTFSRSLASPNTRITDAALGAVRNSQVFHRNIQSMAKDEHMGNIFQSVVDFLPTLIGRGWLWGHQPTHDPAQVEHDKSNTNTVTTTEESKQTIHIQSSTTTIVTEISSKKQLSSGDNEISVDEQVVVQSTGRATSDVSQTTVVESENTNISNSNTIDTMNATTLREQSQSSMSEDFLAIAKKSKWVKSDVMEQRILLHIPTSEVSE